MNQLHNMNYKAFEMSVSAGIPASQAVRWLADELDVADADLLHVVTVACDPEDETNLVYTAYYSIL